ncbi:peroxynitrite isomerase THAP4-like [Rhipicephalus sanguineus]|uniref:peroxynitrite isomerase THAP4-like n=1 Tax=Rhipicephalus sanguineus TaxID=34632 RepID=UPI0020C556A6|nr:peroxynitrite isomerase THAP4-like [Rhipicephalus sanguineus]
MPGCCVPQCTTIWRRGVRMFRFPTCPNRRKRWIAQVKRDCWEPTASSRICEAHFEDTSFEQRRQDGLKKLRPDAIPTLFCFRPLPKHRLPPKNRDAVSNVPPRHPDLSSDRVAGVQPKTASAQVSEVAPVPNVMFAASSVVEPNCASADVDTVQLSLHSGDTPSNAADSSEKDCVFFMDEMEISQGFDHDRSLDCLFGGTTLPQSNVQVANHALVFMIVVLCLSDELLKKRGYRYLLTDSGSPSQVRMM